MRSDATARRYAEALLANVVDPPALDAVQQELTAIAALYRESDDLRNYLLDPSVSPEQRKKLLQSVFGGKVQPVLMHFMDLLLQKHRFKHLPTIAQAFDELVEERRGQARVQVLTAVALPEDQADRLKRTLDGVVGKDCILQTRVDPSIIGGAVAVRGDRVFDGSVRAQLTELRKQLMDAPL